MSKKRKSFLIYIDTLPLFDELNDADELSLCRAINHYHRDLPIERGCAPSVQNLSGAIRTRQRTVCSQM